MFVSTLAEWAVYLIKLLGQTGKLLLVLTFADISISNKFYKLTTYEEAIFNRFCPDFPA